MAPPCDGMDEIAKNDNNKKKTFIKFSRFCSISYTTPDIPPIPFPYEFLNFQRQNIRLCEFVRILRIH